MTDDVWNSAPRDEDSGQVAAPSTRAREEVGEMVQRGHLGGYVVGGDAATWYPELWEWMIREWNVLSMVDIGCGEGATRRFFAERGVSAIGIDGVEQKGDDYVRVWDYASGPKALIEPVDLVWMCEFVEHVDEQYVKNFMATCWGAKWIAMTHASPEQPGWHHVNCRESEYWRGVMAGAGFVEDVALTLSARRMARSNVSPWNHFARSGMVFVPAERGANEYGRWR